MLSRALELADAEGLEAVTVRRLAEELGVTPMALYWHFKNKDLLLVGMLDVVFAEVTVDVDPAAPWPHRLRAMVGALVRVLRGHPWTPSVSQRVNKNQSESFLRATDVALGVLAEAGFPLDRGYEIASHLLNGATSLITSEPGSPHGMTEAEAHEWLRCNRLVFEALPADRFPRLVEYARTTGAERDVEAYYAFGIDMLLAGVEAMAAAVRPAPPPAPAELG